MAWPPNIAAITGVASRNTTTVAWGTDGIYAAYVVKDIRPKDVAEIIYLENGSGLRCRRIELVQGREYAITVEDNVSQAPPAINTAITIFDPLTMSAGAAQSKNVVVTNNDYNAVRKQDGERIITAVYDTMIEGAGSVP